MNVQRFPRRSRWSAVGLLAVVPVLAALPARAQDDVIPEDLVKAAKERSEREDGWTRTLRLGMTGSFNHSNNVVGAADGSTVQLGLVLSGEATLVSGRHEWSNDFSLQHTQSKTPTVSRFVKSLDNFTLQSTYLLRLESVDWAGPFARFHLDTSILEGYEVRAESTTVIRSDLDGSSQAETFGPEEKIGLTGAFEPLILKETVGVYANPATEPEFTMDSKLGVGLQHVIVRDGYAVSDDGATPELELRQLDGATEVGGELEVALSGQPTPEVAWKAEVGFFFPFTSTSDQTFDGLDALNTNFAGSVSVKLAKWVSLDYVLNVKRVPLVLDDWQVQNGVILTAGFDLL